MPRSSRKRSTSGFYHIILRGIGQQLLFEDDEDYERFKYTMKRFKTDMDFEIHAYCLMGNHVHMLINDVPNKIDTIMKKIAGSYAYYFNWKYERVGHLFQDRYKSEAIENDNYYLTVIRYIHQNPQKAGLAAVDEYRWSSHNEYLSISKITDTVFALKLLGGVDGYKLFMNQDKQDNCLEIIDKKRITDEKASEIVRKMCNIRNPQQIQQLEKDDRDTILAALKEKGLSVRQIARLTGLGRGVVYKAG